MIVASQAGRDFRLCRREGLAATGITHTASRSSSRVAATFHASARLTDE